MAGGGKVYRDSSVGENMRPRVQVKARWALQACLLSHRKQRCNPKQGGLLDWSKW